MGNRLNISSKFSFQIKNKLLLLIIALLLFCLCIPTAFAYASSKDNSEVQTPKKTYVSNEPAEGAFGKIMTKEITEISTLAGWAPKELEDELLEFIDSSLDKYDKMTVDEFLKEEKSGKALKRGSFVFLTFIQSYYDPNWVQQQYPETNLLDFNKAMLNEGENFKAIEILISAIQTGNPDEMFKTALDLYPDVVDRIKKYLAQDNAEPDIVMTKAIRDDIKTRKSNHDAGIPDPPIDLQTQIFQILQKFSALNMTKDEVNKYCSEYRYECDRHSLQDVDNKTEMFLQDALSNNDLDKLKAGLVYSWCCWCSSMQYVFYNISESNNMNASTAQIAKCFLRQEQLGKCFKSVLDACGTGKIENIVTVLNVVRPALKGVHLTAFSGDEEQMASYAKKANKALLPYNTSVAKIGETIYPTLQAAFDAGKDSETIILLDNYHAIEPVILKKDGVINVTLDLNKFCIEGHSDSNYIIDVSGDGVVLNVTDSSILENGKILSSNPKNANCFNIQNDGTVLVDAGTYSEDIYKKGYLKEECVQIYDKGDNTYTVFTFDNYKSKTLLDLNGFLQEGDSDNAISIINETVEEIEDLVYDKTKMPEENRQIIDKKSTLAKETVVLDRLEIFEANKEDAISQMSNLADIQDSDEIKELINQSIADLEALEYDPSISPKDNQNIITTNVENFQDELYSIRASEYDKYKEEKIQSLRDMINSGDSAEVKAIIEKAIKDIEALEYDKTINLSDNEEIIDIVVSNAEKDVNNQRLKEEQKASMTSKIQTAQTGDYV